MVPTSSQAFEPYFDLVIPDVRTPSAVDAWSGQKRAQCSFTTGTLTDFR